MNIFPLRRRDVLSELRMPEEVFEHMPQGDADDGNTPVDEPQESIEVSPANELATALVERDIADAVRADNPPPAEPIEMPAPLSQRHLETIDRMVAHLKTDERRLEKQIIDAKRQLADTQLARQGYERNSVDLRRGIAVLIRLANTKPPVPRQPHAARARSSGSPRKAAGENGVRDTAQIAILKPRRSRKLH